jgi:two-component system chemotaxis response regulator CheB
MKRANRYELVVLAASAGGIEALARVLNGLPPTFRLPIAIVQHRSPRLPNLLGQLLQRQTQLRVKPAEVGDMLQAGTVYIARPDLHLIVRPDRSLGMTDGHKVRFVQSSANPLLESAAETLGGGVVAVVLTGGGRDGTDGVQAVKARGGLVIAQDRATSQVFGMPGAAIATGAVDEVLPLDQIAPRLRELAGAEPGNEALEGPPPGAAANAGLKDGRRTHHDLLQSL